MKVLSLYCGAGGIDEGLKQAGIKTTLAIDMEKDCIETIKLNHDCETIIGKVGDYIESFNDFDCIVGGPPCPEFSRAKSDRNFNTCEVDNFWNVIDRCKPKYHLMENVQDIIQVLKKRNFLVNCADYGVPQTRIRRFYTNLELPKPTHSKTPTSDLFGSNQKKWVSVKEALGLDGIIEDRKTVFGQYGNFREYDTENPSNTIVSDARQWYISSFGHSTQNREKITRSIDEPSDTVVVANEMRITNYEIKSLKKIRNRNPLMYKKHPPNFLDASCNTITTKDRACGTDYVTDGQYARKLTNEELAILQGFPKYYKFFGNKTSIRRQIGNAVPAAIPKAFFTSLKVPITLGFNGN